MLATHRNDIVLNLFYYDALMKIEVERMRGAIKLAIFLGDFSPLFAIAYLSLIGLRIDYFPLSLVATSFMMNAVWLHIKKDAKRYNQREFHVTSIDERGPQYVGYLVSYAAAIPSLMLVGGLKGLLIFAIVMLVIFPSYYLSDILFYNPILAACGYRFYKVKVKEGGEMYVVSEDIIRSDEKVVVSVITDRTYLRLKKDVI